MGPQRMFGMTPWVRRLLVANLLVFLVQETVYLNAAATFAFDPMNALSRPWTAVTYLFLHAGILHLAFNLLALFIFGPPVEERMGGRAFIGFYLASGIGGALLSYALILIRPASIVGASAAVYGVMLAFAWYWPDEPIYVFPLPEPLSAKWLVALAVLLSLGLALFPGLQPGVAHIAHLGGFATAFLWLKIDGWRLSRAERRLRGSPERGVLVHPAALTARRGSGETKARPRSPERSTAEIDRVLDKISATGIGSLTPAERRFLHEMSRKMRDRD